MSAAIQLSPVLLFNNIQLILAALGLAFLFIRITYNLFMSPLCAIPGPWHYAISDVFILVHVVRLRQCKRVQELFETYGPVVRIGPCKVVFRDLSTMRNVYSVYKFDKSSYYKSLLTCVFLFFYFSPQLTFRPSLATTMIMRKYMRAYMHLNIKVKSIFSSMTSLDHATHTIRRKSYAPHYAQSNVAQFQSEMREYTFDIIRVSTFIQSEVNVPSRCIDS